MVQQQHLGPAAAQALERLTNQALRAINTGDRDTFAWALKYIGILSRKLALFQPHLVEALKRADADFLTAPVPMTPEEEAWYEETTKALLADEALQQSAERLRAAGLEV